jgi:hypothetical protein
MYKKPICSLFLLLALLALTSLAAPTQAQNTGEKLSGYAWSDTVGWITFDVPTYGVIMSPAGELTGYAWSDNIGWVEFRPSFTGPSGGGDNYGAKKTAGNKITGWARACAGTVSQLLAGGAADLSSPGFCTVPSGASDMVSRTDGWDGWIKFTNVDLTNETVNTGNGTTQITKFVGSTWGDVNVGWIDLYPQYALSGSATCRGVCKGGSADTTPAPSCVAIVSGNEVTGNVSAQAGPVKWRASLANTTTPPDITYLWTSGYANTGSSANEAGKTCSSDEVYSPSVTITQGTNSYAPSCPVVTCIKPLASGVNVSLVVAPSVSQVANATAKAIVIEPGKSAAIKSTVNISNPHTCTASGEFDAESNAAIKSGVQNNTTYQFTTHTWSAPGQYVYVLSCTDTTTGNTVDDSVRITVKRTNFSEI